MLSLMNILLALIKVDREERRDVDKVYMTFIQVSLTKCKVRKSSFEHDVILCIALYHQCYAMLVSRSQTLTPHVGEGLVNCNIRVVLLECSYVVLSTAKHDVNVIVLCPHLVSDWIYPHNK